MTNAETEATPHVIVVEGNAKCLCPLCQRIDQLEQALRESLPVMHGAIGEIEWLHSLLKITSGDCGAILLLRTSIANAAALTPRREG